MRLFVVRLNRPLQDLDPAQVTVQYAVEPGSAVPDRDFVPVSRGTLTFVQDGPRELTFQLPTFDNEKDDGDRRVILRLSEPVGAAPGLFTQAAGAILDDDPFDPLLLDDFERAPDLWDASSGIELSNPEIVSGDPDALPEQGAWERVLEASGPAGNFGRDFALAEDWSAAEALSFWYEGTGSGNDVTVEVLDNRRPDPGPDGWELVWSDEFNEEEGTAPNPDNWSYEIGDGTINGIPGWGNDERQYYTDSTDNAATDGEGNLVITLLEATDGELCYYGECEYTSARLLTKHKAEFAYGRIEASIEVPEGEAGLWPAFWSLGTDIDQVGWPQTGEIDFMEYVSKDPTEVFGTIHGPGYAGGASFGDTIEVEGGVPGAFRTTTIEWTPDRIEWALDGTTYHTAIPDDVAPNEWVFNHPFFLLLNMAIGGNFGGAIDPALDFPKEMKIDYVRVYQGPDTAERFEASFVDDFTGWQQVTIPFADLERSADARQPEPTPRDGLGLTEVWGYGFRVESGSGDLRIDQVRLVPAPDTTPPELAITDNVPEGAATRNVTFTFSFSEEVGDTFDASDVQLTGGTMVDFTRVDGDTATLVARPPAEAPAPWR